MPYVKDLGFRVSGLGSRIEGLRYLPLNRDRHQSGPSHHSLRQGTMPEHSQFGPPPISGNLACVASMEAFGVSGALLVQTANHLTPQNQVRRCDMAAVKRQARACYSRVVRMLHVYSKLFPSMNMFTGETLYIWTLQWEVAIKSSHGNTKPTLQPCRGDLDQ